MKLPKRLESTVIENESINILAGTLPREWIFRDQNKFDDYGIDCEIEITNINPLGGYDVTGRIIKAQVKSTDSVIIFNKDGLVSIGGIKLSTMNYWSVISSYIPTVGFLVDNKNHKVFFNDLYWESRIRYSEKTATSSIYFREMDNISRGLIPDNFRNIIYSPPMYSVNQSFKQFAYLFYPIINHIVGFRLDGYDAFMKNEISMFNTILNLSQNLVSNFNYKLGYLFDINYWNNLARKEFKSDIGIVNIVIKKCYDLYSNIILDSFLNFKNKYDKISKEFKGDAALNNYLSNLEIPDDTSLECLREFIQDKSLEDE